MHELFKDIREELEIPETVRDGHWLGDIYQIYDVNDRLAIIEAASIPPTVLWAEEGFVGLDSFPTIAEENRAMREGEAEEEGNEDVVGVDHYTSLLDGVEAVMELPITTSYLDGRTLDTRSIETTFNGETLGEEPFIDVDPIAEHSSTDPADEFKTETMEEFVESLGIEYEPPHKYYFPHTEDIEGLGTRLLNIERLYDGGIITESEFMESTEQCINRFREKYNFTNKQTFMSWMGQTFTRLRPRVVEDN